MEEPICTISAALGRREACPKDACSLWSDGRCAVAPLRVDVASNAELALYLSSLRESLGRQDAVAAGRG